MPPKAIVTASVRPVDNAAARLLPTGTTVLAAVLMMQPVAIPGQAALIPVFTLMTIYHWTIYRPGLLPPLALFLIGVGYDLISGAPPGLSPLLFLATRAAVLKYRRFLLNRPFPFVWAGFTLVTVGALLGLSAFHLLLDGSPPDFRGTVFRAILTISLFPIASFALGRTQRALMGAP